MRFGGGSEPLYLHSRHPTPHPKTYILQNIVFFIRFSLPKCLNKSLFKNKAAGMQIEGKNLSLWGFGAYAPSPLCFFLAEGKKMEKQRNLEFDEPIAYWLFADKLDDKGVVLKFEAVTFHIDSKGKEHKVLNFYEYAPESGNRKDFVLYQGKIKNWRHLLEVLGGNQANWKEKNFLFLSSADKKSFIVEVI